MLFIFRKLLKNKAPPFRLVDPLDYNILGAILAADSRSEYGLSV